MGLIGWPGSKSSFLLKLSYLSFQINRETRRLGTLFALSVLVHQDWLPCGNVLFLRI